MLLGRLLLSTSVILCSELAGAKPLNSDVDGETDKAAPLLSWPPPPTDVIEKACSSHGVVSAVFLDAWRRVAGHGGSNKGTTCVPGIVAPSREAVQQLLDLSGRDGRELSDAEVRLLVQSHLVGMGDNRAAGEGDGHGITVGGDAKVLFPCLDDADGDPDNGCAMALYVTDRVLGEAAEMLRRPSTKVVFPNFELPRLTGDIARIMEEEMEGRLFADLWRRVSEHPKTVTIHNGIRMTVCEHFSH